MSERVFVDLGAHAGSTVRSVFASRFDFDRVISVEPDPEMVTLLHEQFADKISTGKFIVAPVGVALKRGKLTLFGSNAGGGASLVSAKLPKSQRTGVSVDVISWGDFLDFYELHSSDLYVKVNCEGGEVEIIGSMVEHNCGQIKSMVIDFDIIKSPWGGWQKWSCLRQLRRAGIPYLLSESVFVKGSGRNYIENWLASLKEFSDPPVPRAPVNVHQFSRIKYLEVISALGMRHDFWKRR